MTNKSRRVSLMQLDAYFKTAVKKAAEVILLRIHILPKNIYKLCEDVYLSALNHIKVYLWDTVNFPIILQMETLKSIIHDCVIINQRQQSLRWATSWRLEAETVKSKAVWAHWYSKHLNVGWNRRSQWKKEKERKKERNADLSSTPLLSCSVRVLLRPHSHFLFDLTEIFLSALALQWTVVSLPSTSCMLG